MTDRLQHGWRAIAVLNVSAMHDEADHQAERVGQDVTLAALDPLASIEAANATAFGRLDALAVDDTGGRARLSTFQITGGGDEVMVYPAQDAAVAPVVEVALHGRPVREILGQKRPRAAAGRQIQDGVHHLPQVSRSGAPDRAWSRQERGDQAPLTVRQVA